MNNKLILLLDISAILGSIIDICDEPYRFIMNCIIIFIISILIIKNIKIIIKIDIKYLLSFFYIIITLFIQFLSFVWTFAKNIALYINSPFLIVDIIISPFLISIEVERHGMIYGCFIFMLMVALLLYSAIYVPYTIIIFLFKKINSKYIPLYALTILSILFKILIFFYCSNLF